MYCLPIKAFVCEVFSEPVLFLPPLIKSKNSRMDQLSPSMGPHSPYSVRFAVASTGSMPSSTPACLTATSYDLCLPARLVVAPGPPKPHGSPHACHCRIHLRATAMACASDIIGIHLHARITARRPTPPPSETRRKGGGGGGRGSGDC